jgi:FkbM family methyltransferase
VLYVCRGDDVQSKGRPRPRANLQSTWPKASVDAMLMAPTSAEGVVRQIELYAKDNLFLDVGAYQGDFTKLALSTGCFSGGILFEPNPETLKALRAAIPLTAPIRIVEKAVGETSGTGTLHCGQAFATGSLLPYANTPTGLKSRTVDLISLDSLNLDEPVSLIKIDTQGNDLAVLRGAERLIQKDHPIIIVELIFVPLYLNQASPYEIINWLVTRGYTMSGFFNEHFTDNWLAFADAIFIARELAPPTPAIFNAAPETGTLQEEIAMLRATCDERLALINRLDSDLRAQKVAKSKGLWRGLSELRNRWGC